MPASNKNQSNSDDASSQTARQDTPSSPTPQAEYCVVSGAGVFVEGDIITYASVERAAKQHNTTFNLDEWIKAGSVVKHDPKKS